MTLTEFIPNTKMRETPISAVNLKSDGTETNPHLSLTLRRSTRITGVKAQLILILLRRSTDQAIEGSDGDTFDQPTIPYSAYPL